MLYLQYASTFYSVRKPLLKHVYRPRVPHNISTEAAKLGYPSQL